MKLFTMMKGMALGGALMYLFDPERGTHRRNTIRDGVTGQIKSKRETLDKMTRDFSNRSQGWKAEVKSTLGGGGRSDLAIQNAVRRAIGRCCSHPRAIQIDVYNGDVMLSGPVLAREAQDVLQAAKSVRGTGNIQNLMTMHESEAETTALQGPIHQPSSITATPANSLMVAGGGATMLLYGLLRRGLVGNLLILGGGALAAKAFADAEQRMSGSGSGTASPSATSEAASQEREAPEEVSP